MGLSVIAAVSLAGCGSAEVVEEQMHGAGAQMTAFTIEDRNATLSARFAAPLSADERFFVEWLFPDGRLYLRKSVRRDPVRHDLLETSLPIRGSAPARHPGIWQVRLWRDNDKLVERSFEIGEAAPSAIASAREFANLAHCGPARWDDPVISARRAGPAAPGRPGAWIGGGVLEAAGATYSGVVLLTGCAPR
ncbi:MAG: hypothetical protein GTO67_06890 [Gammaproteobacteria bacterium]|nr:hypothetical protein [Gammaproteobacteria bacterium]NIM71992.1 hypothetical protein [Gammaproteobacteria bacterium]NIN38400.1 hypothetical protein [Gammaproteobacteria bacterium]NIO23719.1 hypothetical protein [Gammaproteobacteria bacterium]NIO64361.1 hypothetical protein [Gammaproteobacteria bacterium]